VVRLYPEKRNYPVQQMPTTESGIHTTWLADLYTALGDRQTDGGWSVRIYYNPLVPWLWAGAVIMVIGGAVSLSDRRYRVGAPARRRRDKALPAGSAPAGT
jgi:cytochrome c-type biogenesis protein CcmF